MKKPDEQHGDGRAETMQLDVGSSTGTSRSATDGSLAMVEPMLRRYRVVIAKPGLDGHDRGAKVIARALRDAGFEVVYTGLFQTPGQVAEAALQEDADAVGLSVLSGAHMTLIPKVVDELRGRGLDDVLVFAGGIISGRRHRRRSRRHGVAEVFTPGSPLGGDHRLARRRRSIGASASPTP